MSFRSPSCSTTKDRVGAVPPAHENDSGALYAQLRSRTRHDQRLGPSAAQEAGASRWRSESCGIGPLLACPRTVREQFGPFLCSEQKVIYDTAPLELTTTWRRSSTPTLRNPSLKTFRPRFVQLHSLSGTARSLWLQRSLAFHSLGICACQLNTS